MHQKTRTGTIYKKDLKQVLTGNKSAILSTDQGLKEYGFTTLLFPLCDELPKKKKYPLGKKKKKKVIELIQHDKILHFNQDQISPLAQLCHSQLPGRPAKKLRDKREPHGESTDWCAEVRRTTEECVRWLAGKKSLGQVMMSGIRL